MQKRLSELVKEKMSGKPILTKIVQIYNLNIAKDTTDPGVDCFDQEVWFGRFSLVCLVGLV